MAKKKVAGSSTALYAAFALLLSLLSLAFSAYFWWAAWGIDGLDGGDTIEVAGALGRLDLITICLAILGLSAIIATFPFSRFIRMVAEQEAREVALEVAKKAALEYVASEYAALKNAEQPSGNNENEIVLKLETSENEGEISKEGEL